MTDFVEFDPGIGNLVIDFSDFINGFYSQLLSFKNINQKRAKFKLFSNKIYNLMKNNICFYQGCLLWAYYLVCSNENAPKQISGNVFLNLSEEQKNNYDYLIQVNFLNEYFSCYERDTLYYTGKKVEIPEYWRLVLLLYKEFLEMNEGFVNTKMTSDIKLPDKIKISEDSVNIKELITECIQNKNLEILMNIVLI